MGCQHLLFFVSVAHTSEWSVQQKKGRGVRREKYEPSSRYPLPCAIEMLSFSLFVVVVAVVWPFSRWPGISPPPPLLPS